MIRPEFSKALVEDRVQKLRAEAKNARRARIAKALKR